MSPEQPRLFQFDQQMVLYSTDTLFFQQFQFNQSNTVSLLRIKKIFYGRTCFSWRFYNALYEVWRMLSYFLFLSRHILHSINWISIETLWSPWFAGFEHWTESELQSQDCWRMLWCPVTPGVSNSPVFRIRGTYPDADSRISMMRFRIRIKMFS